jgi:hypothetical protein
MAIVVRSRCCATATYNYTNTTQQTAFCRSCLMPHPRRNCPPQNYDIIPKNHSPLFFIFGICTYVCLSRSPSLFQKDQTSTSFICIHCFVSTQIADYIPQEPDVSTRGQHDPSEDRSLEDDEKEECAVRA